MCPRVPIVPKQFFAKMKKIQNLLLAFFIFSGFGILCAQTHSITEKEVPSAVKDAFTIAYPNGKALKWEMINQQYFAHLKTKTWLGKEIACFFSDGTWIETRTVVENENLPLSSTEFLAQEYPAYYIYSTSYVEQKDGKPYYFVQLNLTANKNVKVELSFDLAGKLTRVDGLDVVENADTNNTEIAMETEVSRSHFLKTLESNALSEMVQVAFKKHFPQAEKVFWKKEGELQMVRFLINGQYKEAAYFENGEHIYTALYFDKKTIPLPLERYLLENHPKFSLVEGKRVVYESKYKRTQTEKPKDYYRVIISEKIPKSKDVKKTLLRFEQTGQFDYKTEYNEL